jgi:hypothetical protein
VELRAGRPTGPSLFALSEGRRVARAAGATLFAVVAAPPLAVEDLSAVTSAVGAAGADKLLLCEGADLGGPPDDASTGRAIGDAISRVPPLLVLLPAGGAGPALGPPLAARLGGPFAPACDVEVSEGASPPSGGGGRLQLVRLRPDGRSRRRLDPREIERPIVAALGAGRVPPPSGDSRELEVEVVASAPRPDRPAVIEIDRAPDPDAAIDLASILVLIGDDAAIDPAALAAAVNDLPGVAVARASVVPAPVLADACPELILEIGRAGARTRRCPRAQVVRAEIAAAGDPAPDDVDVWWRPPAPGNLDVESLARLVRAVAEGRPR